MAVAGALGAVGGNAGGVRASIPTDITTISTTTTATTMTAVITTAAAATTHADSTTTTTTSTARRFLLNEADARRGLGHANSKLQYTIMYDHTRQQTAKNCNRLE